MTDAPRPDRWFVPQSVLRRLQGNPDADIEAARRDPDAFWLDQARTFEWTKAPTTGLTWDRPHMQWFADGETNITLSALDRHARGEARTRAALIWLSETEEAQVITYGMLHERVERAAAGLRALGVTAGDRVVIYMPLTPEGVIAMLACARLGAVHSVVYAGLGVGALRDRITDAGARVVITADVGYRRGKLVDLYAIASEAIADLGGVEHLVLWERIKTYQREHDARTVPWESLFTHGRAGAVPVNAEHPLYVLYTSGSTGKPKGVIHTHGGYMVASTYHLGQLFDVRAGDVFFCTSDIGWIVGHSYIVYAPLAAGATVLFREGAPDFPDPGVFWRTVERYGVNVLFTAPTALRLFMKLGPDVLKGHDLSSLRVIACAGEALNPEAWRWAQEHLAGGLEEGAHAVVIDHWWQTELGAPILGTHPRWPARPGFVGRPLAGVDADVVDEQGHSLPDGVQGHLVLRRPTPGMMRGIHGNPEKYAQVWTENPAGYLSGDLAVRDEHGYISILGRADDVLNVAGHRIGSADVEDALVAHPAVAEAAVIGVPDDLKGESIVAHVILRRGFEDQVGRGLRASISEHVRRELGPIATPGEIRVVTALPKTRSGKIMRRVLRAQALGQDPGDLTTLEG
ncbi:acetate--CoA ligase [Deinococcus soli (ex Cha et al. 2016)]|uniref:Acetyl-CoA synthetase n=2 Tax=Deinococcus soli (ex Cha et al. 2016) TaxID=1309411 RepID=A0ACC6KJZ7_9DEIO|nr:acetate--CoA ligase [Deinococcus soli (ex Cha et al. 2016)]MDR6219928.1 acetyl-CoA synthetase [Deinococcus soli (ex Cha et al. 2016)]MDR6329814.1 acetyl-CoA synthetase [Deinococcus soli (ex Cha et al. 2016)]MDR6752835.1 acetyl-CoA synthetase [Deinococcus soli (ex Cha et al. 2016)]